MKTTYDPAADAFHGRFATDSTEIAETREATPGVIVDLDAQGKLVGIEILSVRLRASGTYCGKAQAAAAA
jgi:uncharacterized protein YuzE